MLPLLFQDKKKQTRSTFSKQTQVISPFCGKINNNTWKVRQKKALISNRLLIYEINMKLRKFYKKKLACFAGWWYI